MHTLTIDNYPRVIVVGNLQGDYHSLIDVLYEQNFSYQDALVLAGDFINTGNSSSLDIMCFIKNNSNCFAVKGASEVGFISLCDKGGAPEQYGINSSLLDFIEELPNGIEYNNFFIVNKGLEPNKPIEQQTEKVSYTIGLYDRESKYYRFSSEKKHWFDYPRSDKYIIFSNNEVNKIECNAGCNLPYTIDGPTSIILSNVGSPIILAKGISNG